MTTRSEPGFLRKRVSSVENVGNGNVIPSLAGNKVTDVGPLDVVLSSSTVVVSHLTLTVGPERVEEAIVHASASGGSASSQIGRLFLSLSLQDEVKGRGESRGGTAESEEDRRESNHIVDLSWRCLVSFTHGQ